MNETIYLLFVDSPNPSNCKNSPCLAGGTCLLTDTSYECFCVDGRFGINCEKIGNNWNGLTFNKTGILELYFN